MGRRRSASSASRRSARASSRSRAGAGGARTSPGATNDPGERAARVSVVSRVTEADVERLAALVGRPIDPAERAEVATALAALLEAAALVMEFPLPEDTHPAPVAEP